MACWRFLRRENQIWSQTLVAKCGGITGLQGVQTRVSSSHTWRNILKGWEVLKQSLSFVYFFMLIIQDPLFIEEKRKHSSGLSLFGRLTEISTLEQYFLVSHCIKCSIEQWNINFYSPVKLKSLHKDNPDSLTMCWENFPYQQI